MPAETTYAVRSMPQDVGVTGFSSAQSVLRKRKIGNDPEDISPRSQVARVIAVSAELEAIPMMLNFFVQRLVVPTISQCPIEHRAVLNKFLVEVIQNILVVGWFAFTIDQATNQPMIVPPEMYTPMTPDEYNYMMAEDMDLPPAWRLNALNETHYPIFDDMFQQDRYWHPKAGMPVIISGNYGPLIRGYPTSPLATLTHMTKFGAIIHQTNTAAAVKSVSTEAILVSGSVVSPKMLTPNDPSGSIRHLIEARGAARERVVSEQERIERSENARLAGELMDTRMRSAQETQVVQYRPMTLFGVSRRDMAIFATETILRAYGINPTDVGMPPNAVRSAHINIQSAENKQNSIMHMREIMVYSIGVWRITARHAGIEVPDFEIPLPVATDVVSLLMPRLHSDALARLLKPVIDVSAKDFIEPDEGQRATKKHKKIAALPN